MLTSSFIHLKLQDMARYLDEDLGLIPVHELAASLNASREVLLPYLVTLQHLNVVHLKGATADHVHLTMRGRQPLHGASM